MGWETAKLTAADRKIHESIGQLMKTYEAKGHRISGVFWHGK